MPRSRYFALKSLRGKSFALYIAKKYMLIGGFFLIFAILKVKSSPKVLFPVFQQFQTLFNNELDKKSLSHRDFTAYY